MFPGGNSNTYLLSDEQTIIYTLSQVCLAMCTYFIFFSKYIINPLRTLGFFSKMRVNLLPLNVIFGSIYTNFENY